MPHGERDGDLQGLGAASKEQRPIGAIFPLEHRGQLSLSVHPGAERVQERAPEGGAAERRVRGKLVPQDHGIRRTTRGPSMLAMGSGSRFHMRGPHAKALSSAEGVAARCPAVR